MDGCVGGSSLDDRVLCLFKVRVNKRESNFNKRRTDMTGKLINRNNLRRVPSDRALICFGALICSGFI